MDADRWTRLKGLVADALERPAGERAASLRTACADDSDLHAEASALVEASEAAGLVDTLAEALTPRSSAPEATGPPLQIGPYRIVREVGRGGMGTVFLAERADGQYAQRVALKLIRAGAATDDAQQRFRSERQILARLEHAHIARLLDGGVTPPAPDAPDGLPYLVMEYVDGEPVTAYADRHALGLESRLGLFLDVCDAVAYAHRHLVVHRDLKPSNILVAEDDGAPVVKLLDFGVARLLSGDGAEDDASTRTGQRLLTPAYAAPEQLAGEPTTTATDVYALGVLLYELLVGHVPVRRNDGATAHTGRMYAAPDGTDRRLRGDLDTVVRKALRAEPDRRYASSADFADDVRRFLAHEPVRARPDTVGYRVRRFVRRHRAGVAAAALVALAVVGGAGVALWQAGVARAEGARAENEEARAMATLAFFQQTLYTSAPGAARPAASLRDGLDSAAAHVDRDLAGQPLVAAAVHSTVGLSYYNLGEYEAAERQQRRAVALFARGGDLARLDYGVELQNLGNTLSDAGRPDEALPLLRRSVPIQRVLGTPAQLASVLNVYASTLDTIGQTEEAERVYIEAVAVGRRARTENLPVVLNNLALVYEATRRTQAAVPLVEEAVATLRAQGPTAEPYLGPTLATLGSLYDYAGRPDDGAQALDEALVLLRRAKGPDHPLTLQNEAGRALIDVRRGRPAAALPLAREAVAGVRRTLPADHPITPHVLTIYGEALCAFSPDSARVGEPLVREALATRRALYPPGHALVGLTESVEGACLGRLGRHGEARTLLTHGLAILRADRGDADARVADARRRLVAGTGPDARLRTREAVNRAR